MSLTDEFFNYLALILVMREEIRCETRQIAGLTLKSQIEKNFPSLPIEVINYFKDKLVNAFYDPEPAIRITVIVKGGLNIWPEVIQFLVHNIQLNTEPSILENAIESFAMIIEDSAQLFEDARYKNLLQMMLPPIINLIRDAHISSVKAYAVH